MKHTNKLSFTKLLTLLLVLTIAGCGDDNDPVSDQPADELDIVGVAASNDEFSTFTTLVSDLGLEDALTSEDDLTVFAPTNAAFDQLPEGTVDNLTDDQLRSILRYHLVAGTLFSSELGAQQDLETVQGERILILSSGGITVNGSANVTEADIEASNGVIHAVDAVLIPDAFGTVVDNAVKRFNFETLVSAVTDAGLAETLSGEGPFTVFAPTDEAFANLPSGLLESLSNEQLTEILLYHVLPADIKSTDLQPEQAAEALSDENVFVTVSNGEVSVNNRSTVISPDIDAINGTIHGVDQVLLPNQFIDVVDIASKNFDLSTLVTLIQDANLVETLKSDGPFTIFAPVNSAFDDISETLETLTAEQVEDVLTFHVVPQKILSSDLASQQTVQTVNGEEIEIVVDGETVTVEGSATVTNVDLEGTNGVIHLIDSVLIPENL